MSALQIGLVGAGGRMGQAIVHLAGTMPEVEIADLERCDVIIDFSHANATASTLAHGKPVVIGTTGQAQAERDKIAAAAERLPVILSANFSIGVNALFALTRRAAELLGSEFELEVVEMHHRLKKDAPSGTARRLAEILCEARGLDYERDVVHGREGMTGERPARQIGMHALRGGDVVGEHTVIFAGAGERLELMHQAASRDTFAAGALRAAQWLMGKPPGLYSMEDVLGLS